MKQLSRIRLINWHLFDDITINCHGTTYFIGINGAGKSTVLDAVQFALVGGQRDVKFNQAAIAGGRRTVSSYVRGELGTEGQRYLRGDATGVVALEFVNDDGSCFAHGAVIDAYEDNHAPDIVYFIVHNAGLDDGWFFKAPGQLYDTGAFRRHLEHAALPSGARGQVFSRLEDYRAHLLNRLGQLNANFTNKIVKGIAFSPLTNIRDFVHNYLLDENLVDVKSLQEQLDALRHFEGLVLDVRGRIAELEQIEALDQERVASRRRRITNGYVRRQAEAGALLEQLRARRLQRDEADLALKRAELARDGFEEGLKSAQEALLEAQVALQTDTTAARQRELREAIGAQEGELSGLTRQRDELLAGLAAGAAAMGRLRALLASDGASVPTALDRFVLQLPAAGQPDARTPGIGGPGQDDEPALDPAALGEAMRSLQTDLETLGQGYADRRALLAERVRELREEGQRLQGEIARLHTGDREASYEAEAPAAARLRRLLRAELGLGPDDVVYLCQVLQVPDEAWQDAVEGVLGVARFHLIVPPEHYDAAMRLYRARRGRDGLYGVGLPDSDRILRAVSRGEIRPAGPGRLAGEVRADHPAARAYVDLLLGNYVKCDELEELRDYRTAVTRECFVRRQFSTMHLDPDHYRRWFIGNRAIPRQIAQREERLGVLSDELAGLAIKVAGLDERIGLTRDRARSFVDLERALPVLVRVPEVATALQALREELAGLDTRTIGTLQAEVTGRRARLDDVQARLGEVQQRIGSLQSELRVLGSELIPGLERQAADAGQAGQRFLASEEAEAMLEEVQKEYERRRERQALEVVRDNATHYEVDYMAAEGRNRDDLRRAKQAYSLRYDFGYDDEEGAARYAEERQKYVESELPAYEERVARQRGLAEQELVENFIHRLREQIGDARQQLEFLNDTLRRLRFGGERYEFITTPAGDLRQVYDMIMDSQAVLGTSLFEGDFRRKHQEGWDLLFERLTIGPDHELAPELLRLQDYRNYLSYDIRIHYPNGDRALHSQISTKKSGGETTTPFYVAMAASFAQAYRLNQPRPSDTIRLAIFDEAFGKMDTARTASALKFMIDTGLQVLLATPPDKAGGLLPHVDSVRTVVRQGNHSFVLDIDKREMEEELEKAAP